MDGIREEAAMQPSSSCPRESSLLLRPGSRGHSRAAARPGGREGSARGGHEADLIRKPWRMDYPAEIKRWRALADQAEQMARRWKLAPWS